MCLLCAPRFGRGPRFFFSSSFSKCHIDRARINHKQKINPINFFFKRLWHFDLPSSPLQHLVCCSFLEPLDEMPFDGALLHFLLLIAVAVFSGTMCNKAGMLFTEHPDRPRTSMLLPIVQSAVNTVRMIDNFTDISTIRLVIAQVWTRHCTVVSTVLLSGVLDLFCPFRLQRPDLYCASLLGVQYMQHSIRPRINE
jgi:hypothetical protein